MVGVVAENFPRDKADNGADLENLTTCFGYNRMSGWCYIAGLGKAFNGGTVGEEGEQKWTEMNRNEQKWTEMNRNEQKKEKMKIALVQWHLNLLRVDIVLRLCAGVQRGGPCAEGERIGIRVDLKDPNANGTITYFRNGANLGASFYNVKGPLRPALAIVRNQEVRLLGNVTLKI